MKCPYCLTNTKVLDKRESKDATRRRRECLKCKKRFTTYERIETHLVVIKKDGRREPYIRDKIKNGILKACEKRPISQEKIDKCVSEIEEQIKNLGKNEIQSKIIGETIIKKLKKLDKIAYIRFASVYLEFKDVDEFNEKIKELKRENGKK
jgi:transcriptional repressor NrdR